jgi:hypothetical protein
MMTSPARLDGNSSCSKLHSLQQQWSEQLLVSIGVLLMPRQVKLVVGAVARFNSQC